MPVERIDLNDYVDREDRLITKLAKAAAHPVATTLNLASRGAGMVRQAFYPPPPGTDPMSLAPQELMRQLRQGIVSDEDLAAIQRDPTSMQSFGAYANAAIMLSRGAGEGEHLNWRMIPGEEWSAMKEVQSPMVGPGPGKPAEVIRPAVRQDSAGNYYEYQGSHVTYNPVDTETGRTWEEKHHVIAIPVDSPMGSSGWVKRLEQWSEQKGKETDQKFKDLQDMSLEDYKKKYPEPGSPEWFQQKAVDFQAKHGLPPVEPSDKSVDPNVAHLSQQDAINHFMERQGANTDTYDATLQHIAHIQDAMDKKLKINADAAESYYSGGEHYGALLKKMGWSKDGDFYYPPLEPGGGKPLPPGPEEKKVSDFIQNLPIKEDTGPPDAPLPDWAKDQLPPKKPEPGSKDYWKNIADQYTGTMLPEDVAKLPDVPTPPETPPEGVGPVDWNWYKPKTPPKWGEDLPIPEGSWGNINDRKYSGPLVGQTWADIYATPDIDFTVGPGKASPDDIQSFLDSLEGTQYDSLVNPPDLGWPPGTESWAESPPNAPDMPMPPHWQQPSRWLWKPPEDRFNWEPPPEP